MSEEIKERLSKTGIEIDFSKINFDGLPQIEQDNRKYEIHTGTIPVEFVKV